METRLSELMRLKAEIAATKQHLAEQEERFKHLAWAAERAGEVRITAIVEPVCG